MMLDILKKSLSESDRQLYVKGMKDILRNSQQQVEQEKEYQKKLKIKISEFDIYNQKSPYDSSAIKDSTGSMQGTYGDDSGLGRGADVEEVRGTDRTSDNPTLDTSDIPW